MDDASERSRARAARFHLFSTSVRVREDIPQMRPLYKAARDASRNKARRRLTKDAVKRANAIAAAQRVCGSGLAADTYLRQFLQEYNGRLFAGEGLHMPSSFNIMRAMIEPDERALVLRLLPQHLNLVSFSRMLDHLTDPSIDTRLVSSCRAIDELVIYEVDMLGGHAEFHIPGVEDHIFCGAAFCREGEELSIFGLFGRPPTVAEPRIERIDPANLHPGKRFLYERGATVDMSDQPLLGDTQFAPLLLMARVDLAGELVQVRYVLEETKDTFRVASDDPDEIAALAAIRMVDPATIEKYVATIEAKAPLFELLFSIPSCLSMMETEDVTLERRPTGMRLSPQGRDAKRATSLPIFEAPRFVTVRTLFDLGSNTSSYKLRASDMAIETSGYWKTLPIGSEGRDKMDRPVQGRTWVTTQSSWFESRNAAVRSTTAPATVEPLWSDEDVGYLYVMRNAVHPRDVYKIGYTAKSVDQRADQLGATTGQPDMFNIVQRWSIRSPRVIEHEVHALLADHRVNDRREFFKLRYERIRETIEQVIEKTGARWDA